MANSKKRKDIEIIGENSNRINIRSLETSSSSSNLIENLFRLFVNRTDIYSIFLPSLLRYVDENLIESGEIPSLVRELGSLYAQSSDPRVEGLRKKLNLPTELTKEVVERHLEGEVTVGVYQIDPSDNCVKWICFDVDYTRPIKRPQIHLRLFQVSQKYFNENSILLEDVRSRVFNKEVTASYHLWMFLDPPIDLITARRVGMDIISSAGVERGVELIPREVSLLGELLESFVKLPLASSKKRGSSCFLDPHTLNLLNNEYLSEVQGTRIPFYVFISL